MERLNRLHGRSVSSVCFTAFWQNGGEAIAKQTIARSVYTIRRAV